MKLNAADYLNRPARVPHWIRILVILVLICLACTTFLAIRDIDRESKNLEKLYLEKGESLIRNVGVALKRNWIDEKSAQGLLTFVPVEDGEGALFIATTDYKGELRGIPSSEQLIGPTTLGQPELPQAFHPQWKPFFKTITMLNGNTAFVVYRPLLSSVLKPPEDNEHHKKEPPAAPPKWPPEDLDFSTPDKAVFVWVGFDTHPFRVALSAKQRDTAIFVFLVVLNLVCILTAVSWALKSMRNYAVTKEIITRLPLGLVIDNPHGRVILANQAAQKLAGLTEKDFLGQTLKGLTHDVFPDDNDLTAQEMDISFKDAPCLRLSITCGHITGPRGDDLGRVVLMTDLGELDRLKEALTKQERMVRLGGMASGLAHEIRNPLGAIKGLTQHLLNKATGEAEKDPLQVILNSVERMVRTISDFQAYANPAINAERVELTDFLTKLHNEFSQQNAGSAIAMDLDLPLRQLYVQVDPSQLKEAIRSLYQNAFQAMERNQQDKPGLLKIALKRTGTNRASITLSDNGPGFGQQQLKTPFLPYFSSKAQSSGLGLAKAYNVIQASRGNITLANNREGGAMVTVTLPLEYDGISELRLSNLDMTKLLKEIHNFISYDSIINNISLTLDVPNKSQIILGDKDLLTQAITNIYLNGIQAVGTNPPERPGQLEVRLNHLEENSLSIVFADNGPGFEQAQLDKPFVPFFTTKSKGMGLGMSIIRNIIEAHKGEVKLENRPQGGGQVTVILFGSSQPYVVTAPTAGLNASPSASVH
jgi:two-component system sensor histidine kinase HydH